MDELFRRKILALLDQRRTMRPAGRVAAGHTVGYANDGFASNLERDDRVSLAIDDDPAQVMDITGLSMAARANVVADPTEAEKGHRAPDVAAPGPEGGRPTDTETFRSPRLPPDTDSHLCARLFQGIWAHRPRRLLKTLPGCRSSRAGL